jgi:hypothetical protein
MIAAPVQCDVDGIPKRSHYARVPPMEDEKRDSPPFSKSNRSCLDSRIGNTLKSSFCSTGADSNSERGNPDCRMMLSDVPFRTLCERHSRRRGGDLNSRFCIATAKWDLSMSLVCQVLMPQMIGVENVTPGLSTRPASTRADRFGRSPKQPPGPRRSKRGLGYSEGRLCSTTRFESALP